MPKFLQQMLFFVKLVVLTPPPPPLLPNTDGGLSIYDIPYDTLTILSAQKILSSAYKPHTTLYI
jgi:hypothetical protein